MFPRASWSLERHINFKRSIESRTPEKRAEISKNISTARIGIEPWNKGKTGLQVPWNKGNNWKTKYSKEEIRAINAERQRNRRAKNPTLRINESVSCLIRYSLLGKKNGCRWEKLVGYSLQDLLNHIEGLFQPGMSWENYGEWHIDHIKPRSSFTYITADDPQFLECWSLKNLRPLWAIENLHKGAKE